MTEYATTTDGVRIAYESAGRGAPVLLLHGYASSIEQNWHTTGWLYTLTQAGRQAIALDFRGHGNSDKPHDPASYGEAMVNDIVAVAEALQLKDLDVVGYSMGGSLAILMAHLHPQWLRRIVIAGVGSHYFDKPLPVDSIANALERDTESTGLAQNFKLFASQPGKDKKALAACIRAMPPRLPRETLRTINHPILVVAGERDDVAGSPTPLASAFRFARPLTLPRRDHMSAVGDLTAKQQICEFLKD